jgi:amino acid transporter
MNFSRIIIWTFAACTALLPAFVIPITFMYSPRSSGPEGGFATMGLIAAFPMFMIAILILLACWKLFPRESFSKRRLLISLALYFIAVTTTYASIRFSGEQTMILQFCDDTGTPVSNLSLTFEHSPEGGGIAGLIPSHRATLETDHEGKVVVLTDNRHKTRIVINDPNYPKTTLSCDRVSRRNRKQSVFSWLNPTIDYSSQLGVRSTDVHGFRGYIPSQKKVSLKLFLPRNNTDIIPLPPEGDWIKYAEPAHPASLRNAGD